MPTPSPPLTPEERDAFFALQETARAVRRCEPSPDGTVLIALIGRPGRRMPTAELGATLGWEKSRLSHHLSRMERRGLVTREQDHADLRAWFVLATEAGSAAGTAALHARNDAVRRLLAGASAWGEIAAAEAGEAGHDQGEPRCDDGDDGQR